MFVLVCSKIQYAVAEHIGIAALYTPTVHPYIGSVIVFLLNIRGVIAEDVEVQLLPAFYIQLIEKLMPVSVCKANYRPALLLGELDTLCTFGGELLHYICFSEELLRDEFRSLHALKVIKAAELRGGDLRDKGALQSVPVGIDRQRPRVVIYIIVSVPAALRTDDIFIHQQFVREHGAPR